MSGLGLPWKKKASKSKSMTDLSGPRIGTALSSSQKSILINALNSSSPQGRQTANFSFHRKDSGGRRTRLAAGRSSENNLTFLATAITPDRVSLVSQDSVTQLSNSMGTDQYRTLRKCQSVVETSTNASVYQKMHESTLKKKDLKRFQKIFTPVIGEETFYECYSCALYQDSIASGYLYLTFNWFCFYSNFMGRQRQVAIDVNKILSISQEKTAKIIPNAIKITTDNDTFVFSSFISRDRAYKTLVSLWNKTEEPPASGESDDLSDVESMTRIVSLSDYTARPSSSHVNRSETEDTSSEHSNPGTELNLPQPDSTSDFIEFTVNPSSNSLIIPAAETEDVVTALPDQPIQSGSPRNPAGNGAEKMQCGETVLWHKAERGLVCLQSVVQWCYSQSSAVLGETHRFYNILIICTLMLAFMTFYLGLRMFIFEQEQISTVISRQLRIRENNMGYQFESTIEMNHKLITQMSEILTTVQKLLQEAKHGCNGRVAL